MDIAEYVEIEISHYMLPFFIDKGSIAVDGTSLTVFQVDDLHSTVTISLIPQTQSDTILNDKRIGDEVNIECDMLAKYIFRFNQIGNKKNNDHARLFISAWIYVRGGLDVSYSGRSY